MPDKAPNTTSATSVASELPRNAFPNTALANPRASRTRSTSTAVRTACMVSVSVGSTPRRWIGTNGPTRPTAPIAISSPAVTRRARVTAYSSGALMPQTVAARPPAAGRCPGTARRVAAVRRGWRCPRCRVPRGRLHRRATRGAQDRRPGRQGDTAGRCARQAVGPRESPLSARTWQAVIRWCPALRTALRTGSRVPGPPPGGPHTDAGA